MEELSKATGVTSEALSARALQLQEINTNNLVSGHLHDWSIGMAQDRESYKTDLNAALAANPGLDTNAYLGDFLRKQEATRAGTASSMPSPAAQAMFNDQSRRMALINASSLATETHGAWLGSTIKTAEGTIKLQQGIAIGLGGDPDNVGVAAALKEIGHQSDVVAAATGLGGDAQKAYLLEHTSPIYETLVENAINSGNIDGAQHIFTAHQGSMTPEAQRRLLGALKAGTTANEINSFVSDVYDKGAAPTLPASTLTSPAEGSRAARNNNPLNITGSGYAGQTGQDGRFARFSTPEAGYAAADHLLATYGSAHGVNTLSGVISRWAPPSENDTAAYIATVSKATGIDPNAPINLQDPATRHTILTAMAKVEGGGSSGGGVASRPAITFNEPPPKFDPNTTDPEIMKAQYLAYNQRAVQAIPDATLRARTLAALDARANLAAQTANAAQKGTYDTLMGYVTGGLNGQAVTSYEDLPQSLTSRLSDPYKNSLRENLNRAASGYGAFKTQAMTDEANRLTALAGADPSTFLTTVITPKGLSTADYDRLSGMQIRMKTSFQYRSDKEAQWQQLVKNPDVDRIVTAQFEQGGPAGDINTPPTAENPRPMPQRSAAHLAFMGALIGEVEHAQAQQPGKPLSQEQVSGLANKLMLQLHFAGGRQVSTYAYVPPAAEARIRQGLIASGNPAPSRYDIQREYFREGGGE
jgi:hypothetical protein